MSRSGAQARGRLHVVATPIGNVGDLSPRAAETLGNVALIAAEDTRRTGRLLSHFGVKTRLLACHEHNESNVLETLLAALEQGDDVAIVSDAGTPLISDPGWRLVRTARERGIQVVAVPGPSAVTAALSVSGLPTDRFTFEGFLPRRATQRRERLQALADDVRTLVFFEAVHRVEATLADMVRIFGEDRPAAIARELTKIHEATASASLATLQAGLGNSIPLLGEFVIVVGGAEAEIDAADSEITRVYAALSGRLSPSDARQLCAEITGASRNRVYALTQT
jgi:16S rRNA (cytidine1402-2'-O)-methyltransferase